MWTSSRLIKRGHAGHVRASRVAGIHCRSIPLRSAPLRSGRACKAARIGRVRARAHGGRSSAPSLYYTSVAFWSGKEKWVIKAQLPGVCRWVLRFSGQREKGGGGEGRGRVTRADSERRIYRSLRNLGDTKFHTVSLVSLFSGFLRDTMMCANGLWTTLEKQATFVHNFFNHVELNLANVNSFKFIKKKKSIKK